MTPEEFEKTLGADAPPPGLHPLLLALWHEARGDWEAAHRIAQADDGRDGDRLRSIVLSDASPAVGRTLSEFELPGVVVTALVRGGQRILRPAGDAGLEAGDTLVLFGAPDDLQKGESTLLG